MGMNNWEQKRAEDELEGGESTGNQINWSHN